MPTSSQGRGQSTKTLHFSICACHRRQSPRHGHHTLAPRRPGWCLLSGVCSGTEYLNETCACNNTCALTSYTGPHTATDGTRRFETQSGTLRPAKKPGFPTAPAESAARQCNMARHPSKDHATLYFTDGLSPLKSKWAKRGLCKTRNPDDIACVPTYLA